MKEPLHPDVKLITQEQRVAPTRGLIVTHNRWGKAFAPIDLKRWIRYVRIAFKTEKIDVLDLSPGFAAIADLFKRASAVHVALSLRTICESPPPDLAALKDKGLHDVFLCPGSTGAGGLDAWLAACRAAQLPIRVQFQSGFGGGANLDGLAARLAEAGVVAVNLALSDPFGDDRPCQNATESRGYLEGMQGLASRLEALDIEANILHVPLCLLDEEHLKRAANSRQCALDHQQYTRFSHELAVKFYGRRPITMNRIMLILLARKTFQYDGADNLLLPWLLDHEYAHVLFGAWRRLSWKRKFLGRVPSATSKEAYEKTLSETKRLDLKTVGPVCASCRLRQVCDHETKAYRDLLPGVPVKAQEGEVVAYPLQFNVGQPKYYDAIDEARRNFGENEIRLAERAKRCTATRPPDRIIGSEGYVVEDAHSEVMEGGIKWYALTNSEKRSSPIARLEPPFTIAVDFGGGIAEYIGFSGGRSARVMCPMEAYRHTLTLHVEADGSYVLLRDNEIVRPVEFGDYFYAPPRMPGVLSPRICISNILEAVTTHNIRIWEGESPAEEPTQQVKYSVLVVCTRFSRRLQAVLRNIAHQRDFDLGTLEIIVCYVPGYDGTDDLLDSFVATYPGIRVVRSPFPEQRATAKGFLINESFGMAKGEWLMLLDADTLLPPDMFSRIEAVSDSAEFIAPDGRKLLTPETTAKILMGEIEPWNEWDQLLKGSGDYRHREAKGVPVGFCQCFKTKYLEELPYIEIETFEWADMDFGKRLLELAGPEHRLSGAPVIHLDHGSSQWFGTPKHL